jgi:hypothetical protein
VNLCLLNTESKMLKIEMIIMLLHCIGRKIN